MIIFYEDFIRVHNTIDFYMKGIPNSKFNIICQMSTAYLYGNHKEKFYTKYIFYFMDGVEKRIKRNKRSFR